MPLINQYLPGNGFRQSDFSPMAFPTINSEGVKAPTTDWVRKRQPFLDDWGRACVTIHDLDGGWTANDSRGGEKKKLLRTYLINDLRNMGYQLPAACNAVTLPFDAWAEIDAIAQKAARQRLRFVEDLEAAVPYGGFNAYGKPVLLYRAMSDPGEAVVDMFANVDARVDTPLEIFRSVPMPITHSDFGYADRELEISRSGPGEPFDTFMIEACGRRIAEMWEDQAIGMVTGLTYGGVAAGPWTITGTSTVYGARTFPQRLTKTNFTVPTTTNGPTTYAEVLAALDQLYANFFYGPFVLYHSTEWTQYMHSPFTTSGGNHPGETLRTMLLKNPDIADVRRLDRLTGLTGGGVYTLLFVQMTTEVVEYVNGMELTPIQWEEKGGLEHRWKLMSIKVPRWRSDYNSRTGVLHGTTA